MSFSMNKFASALLLVAVAGTSIRCAPGPDAQVNAALPALPEVVSTTMTPGGQRAHSERKDPQHQAAKQQHHQQLRRQQQHRIQLHRQEEQHSAHTEGRHKLTRQAGEPRNKSAGPNTAPGADTTQTSSGVTNNTSRVGADEIHAANETEGANGADVTSELYNEFYIYKPSSEELLPKSQPMRPEENDQAAPGAGPHMSATGGEDGADMQGAAAASGPSAASPPLTTPAQQHEPPSGADAGHEQRQAAHTKKPADTSGAGSGGPADNEYASGQRVVASAPASQEPAVPLEEFRPSPTATQPLVNMRMFCIGSLNSQSAFNWLCRGIELLRVPKDLEPKPVSLRLSHTGIESLDRDSLVAYRQTLRDFSIENAPKLETIEAGAFAQLRRLRVVYILLAPKLVAFDREYIELDKLSLVCAPARPLISARWLRLDLYSQSNTTVAISGAHPDLTIIRIHETGLRRWPDLSQFKQEKILTSIDLDNNKIESLGPEPINIRTELLNLEFNRISSIDEHTFNGSIIGVLSLNENRRLTHIHERAFANLKNLVKLDLSGTSISQLPTVGLHQLASLIMRRVLGLKRIPSIYVFPALQEAHLTYAYHCCSFQYPKTHDPSAHELHLKLQEEINALCVNKRTEITIDAAQATGGHSPGLAPGTTGHQPQSEFEGFFGEAPQQPTPSSKNFAFDTVDSASRYKKQRVTPDGAEPDNSDTKPTSQAMLEPVIENLKERLGIPYNIECGELVNHTTYQNITCTPVPDAFNPCEDIMGNWILRIAVWFVVAAAVFGNMSVIVVIMGVFRRMSVTKFLQLNLAIGDLFMGVYLAMLALADLTTVGAYFNDAIDWQHGFGCKVAGGASLFASQLSIFTLSVITFERYYTITYSIDRNKRLQLGWAARIMLVGWVYAFASAMLPVFADVNSYNTSAFVIIFACYLKMYLLILRQKTQATAKELTVAMRMALLVSTDFACWAPIIFFGMTALFKLPLISVTNSKILIVFFYPLNSMANPFLYAISTRQYRRDLDHLANRWHTWRRNLFRHNSDSFYGNNYIGLNQHPGALNVHLGAVAAMTGVANHLHHYQLAGDSNDIAGGGAGANCAGALVINTGDGIKLHEQRVVCHKGHKSHYIIRHQILASKSRPAANMRVGRKCSKLTADTHRNVKRSVSPGRPLAIAMTSDDSNNLQLTSSDAHAQCTGGAGKQAKRKDGELQAGQLKQRKSLEACKARHHLCGDSVNARCCRCCPAHSCSDVRARRRATVIAADATGRYNARGSPIGKTTHAYSNGAQVARISPMRRVTVPSLSSGSVTKLDSNNSADSRELYSGALVDDIFRESLDAGFALGPKGVKVDAAQSIDILGNLSINEQTSSTSGANCTTCSLAEQPRRHHHHCSKHHHHHHHHHKHDHHQHHKRHDHKLTPSARARIDSAPNLPIQSNHDKSPSHKSDGTRCGMVICSPINGQLRHKQHHHHHNHHHRHHHHHHGHHHRLHNHHRNRPESDDTEQQLPETRASLSSNGQANDFDEDSKQMTVSGEHSEQTNELEQNSDQPASGPVNDEQQATTNIEAARSESAPIRPSGCQPNETSASGGDIAVNGNGSLQRASSSLSWTKSTIGDRKLVSSLRESSKSSREKKRVSIVEQHSG